MTLQRVPEREGRRENAKTEVWQCQGHDEGVPWVAAQLGRGQDGGDDGQVEGEAQDDDGQVETQQQVVQVRRHEHVVLDVAHFLREITNILP